MVTRRRPPSRKPAKRRPSKRRVANPAAPGTKIARALATIDRTVSKHASAGTVRMAADALMVVVPFKKGVAARKREIREAMLDELGEGDRAYINASLRSDKPGVLVRAPDLMGRGTVEGDLGLIPPRATRMSVGFKRTDQTVRVAKADIMLSRAVAADDEDRTFPIAEVARVIASVYAFGDSDADEDGPTIALPRGRY